MHCNSLGCSDNVPDFDSDYRFGLKILAQELVTADNGHNVLFEGNSSGRYPQFEVC